MGRGINFDKIVDRTVNKTTKGLGRTAENLIGGIIGGALNGGFNRDQDFRRVVPGLDYGDSRGNRDYDPRGQGGYRREPQAQRPAYAAKQINEILTPPTLSKRESPAHYLQELRDYRAQLNHYADKNPVFKDQMKRDPELARVVREHREWAKDAIKHMEGVVSARGRN